MASEVEVGWLCKVVAHHAPAFFLHPADRYMPCTAEFFLQHSELRQAAVATAAREDDISTVLLPRGRVTAPLLLEAQRAAPPGSHLWLHLDPAARMGMPREALDEVPIYAHPKLILGPSGQVEALEITYITLYAYNGAYRVGGVGLLKTGAHDGDWEHCTARVHPTSGELVGVWYNAHRSRDGCWVVGPEVPRDPQSGRVAAFVALHGHGTYPQPGRVLRHFFLGNDLCSAAGSVWRPTRVVLLTPLHDEGAASAAGATSSAVGPGAHHGSVWLDSAPAEEEGEVGQVSALQTSLDALQLDAQQRAAEAAGAGFAPCGSNAGSSSGITGMRSGSAAVCGRRKLVQALSRGSSLSFPGGDAVAALANGAACGAASGSDGSGLPEVVVDDACEWLFFRGCWGTIDAPICQPWFHRAEPPVSRTRLLRLFGHFVSEPA